MIRFRAWETEFRVHILAIIATILAYMLGLGNEIPYILLAVGVHETAHLVAAKLCGLEIEYVDIMCFGGAVNLRNMYGAGRGRLTIIALAGPAANLILAMAAASLAWWGMIGFYPAYVLVKTDLILMVFNLMPALPLDGGRVLYVVLSRWLGKRTALRVGAGFTFALALFLVGAAIWGWISAGVFNITLVIMAVFITASALKELDENGDTERTIAALCNDIPVCGKAELAVMPADAPIAQAAAYFRKNAPTVFAMSENGLVTELITGEEMARRIMQNR